MGTLNLPNQAVWCGRLKRAEADCGVQIPLGSPSHAATRELDSRPTEPPLLPHAFSCYRFPALQCAAHLLVHAAAEEPLAPSALDRYGLPALQCAARLSVYAATECRSGLPALRRPTSPRGDGTGTLSVCDAGVQDTQLRKPFRSRPPVPEAAAQPVASQLGYRDRQLPRYPLLLGGMSGPLRESAE